MKFWSNQKGFTMIELIIVIIILGILAAVAVPKYFSMTSETENAACVANQKAIQSAILMEYSRQLLSDASTSLSDVAGEIEDSWFSTGSVPTCPKDDSDLSVSVSGQVVTVTCPNGHTQ